jgi:uncharacterized CHY-type Zn-finger protein
LPSIQQQEKTTISTPSQQQINEDFKSQHGILNSKITKEDYLDKTLSGVCPNCDGPLNYMGKGYKRVCFSCNMEFVMNNCGLFESDEYSKRLIEKGICPFCWSEEKFNTKKKCSKCQNKYDNNGKLLQPDSPPPSPPPPPSPQSQNISQSKPKKILSNFNDHVKRIRKARKNK